MFSKIAKIEGEKTSKFSRFFFVDHKFFIKCLWYMKKGESSHGSDFRGSNPGKVRSTMFCPAMMGFSCKMQ